MRYLNRQFNEFKSIFITDNILKENERHANIVTASTMFNLFVVVFIGWILNQLNISKEETINMTYVVINCFLGLFIPAILCFVLKGEKSWLKYLLLGMLIVILVSIEKKMTHITAFLMVIPVILSARYYHKKFTILTSFTTLIAFSIASIISGVDYIANYQSIISAFLLYYVIVFASVQISQSGKNMIEKQKEISEKGTRIETELNLAKEIQKSMLPSIFPPFPEHDELDLYACMIPAKEVGGDFYDMFLLDDDHLVIGIADVSGKGIPASLVMMITKILIKNVTKIESDIDNAFKRINNMLCDGNTTGTFITCWFGILNLKTGKVQFINAGHNPPLLYSKEKGFNYLESKANLVLAGKEDMNYQKQEFFMQPGDRLFLYTDGVVEATNKEDKLYDTERLQSFLNKNLDLDAKETIHAVKEDIDQFVGEQEQFDDITMLELIYKENITISKDFAADVSELSKVQDFVEEELKKYHCTEEKRNEIKLAVEEIFVNIAKYAYPEEKGRCTIDIKENKNRITLVFKDEGVEFNPLENENPDTSLSADKRNIGGLGIYLTKIKMDSMDYRYINNKNILTISKKIEKEQENDN